MAIVAGPAGIGKRTLLGAAVAEEEERGGVVAWGHCRRRGAPALWPWARMAARLLGASDPRRVREALWTDADTITQAISDVRLAGSSGQARSPQAARVRDLPQLRRAFSDFFLRMASQQPVTLVLHDLQWADVESLELLDYLSERMSAAPLSIIGTCREVGRDTDLGELLSKVLGRAGADLIRLRGFAAADVHRLVEAVSGTRPDATVVDAIARASRGNPLLVLELTRLVRESGNFTRVPATTVVEPVTLAQVVRKRMGRLPTEAARLLRLAAITGEVFQVEQLALAAGIGQDLTGQLVDMSVDAGLVMTHPAVVGRRRFAHDPVAECLADGLPVAQRDEIRREVARRLAHAGNDGGGSPTPPRPGRSATPASEGPAYGRRQVLALLKAWDQSLEHGNVRTADGLADQLWECGLRDPHHGSRMAASLARGVTALQQGQPATARALLEDNVDLWEVRPKPLLAAVLQKHECVVTAANSAWACWLVGDGAEADRLIGQGKRLATQMSHLPTLAYAVFGEACVAAFTGDSEAVERRAQELRVIARDGSLRSWFTVAAVFHGWAVSSGGIEGAGPQPRGVDLITRALVDLGGGGMRIFRPFFLGLLADACWKVGRLAEGLAAAADGLAAIEAAGDRFYEAELLRLHGEISLAGPVAHRAGGRQSLERAVLVAQAQSATSLEARANASIMMAS